MAAILVIHPSPVVRETIATVLGSEHAITDAASWDTVPQGIAPDLVVFGAGDAALDLTATAAARRRVAPHAPLVLLHAPGDVAGIAPADHPVAHLPPPFHGRGLRACVRMLLGPRRRVTPSDATVAHHRRVLEPPFLPAAASALARRAALAPVPVLVVGEDGTGTTDVARAIHFFSGGDAITVRRAPDASLDALPPFPASLVVEHVERLPPAGQARLVELLRGDADAPRVFATTAVDLDAAVGAGAFSAELAYALDVVRVVIPPLRERLADVPALVAALLPDVVTRLRLEPVSLTDAALARLQRYLWFGNVAELASVLTRTLAVHRPRVLEADMLLFEAARSEHELARDAAERAGAPVEHVTAAETATKPADPTAAAAVSPPAPARAPSAAAPPARGRVVALERRRVDDAVGEPAVRESEARAPVAPSPVARTPEEEPEPAGPSLEMLLGELAHELRNPMVTVKTFAQHLDSVVADPETRARFGALTGEAISRMDALLERLLDFARFGTPIPQPFDLYALLVRAVEERADELARKDVRLQHTRGVRVLVDADESQVTFALRSLVDGLVDHVVPRTPLRAVAGASGDVMLALGVDRAVASRLAAYVAGGTRSATGLPPLVLALATALIRRNRGRLDTRVDDEGTTVITLALPRTAAGVA